METKFKKEYHDKLVELGVLEQFKCNWKNDRPKSRLSFINKQDTFQGFVAGAFYWGRTPEGHEFWSKISKS